MIRAVLSLDGRDYPIRKFSYKFERQIDYEGLPASKIDGGTIRASLLLPEHDPKFAKWAANDSARKDGKITIIGIREGKGYTQIEFKDAYLVEYECSFDRNENHLFMDNLLISARMVFGDNWSFENG